MAGKLRKKQTVGVKVETKKLKKKKIMGEDIKKILKEDGFLEPITPNLDNL